MDPMDRLEQQTDNIIKATKRDSWKLALCALIALIMALLAVYGLFNLIRNLV